MNAERKRFYRLAALAAGLLLGYWALENTAVVGRFFGWLGALAAPFAIGGALAFLLHVPLRAIENALPKKLKKGRRMLALCLTLLAVLAVLALVVGLVVPQLVRTFVSLGQRLPEVWQSVILWLEELAAQYPALPDTIEQTLSEWQLLDWQKIFGALLGFLSNGGAALVGSTVTAATGLLGGVVNAGIGLVFGFYLLAQKENLARQAKMLLYALLPERGADETLRICRLVDKTFSSFLSGQCLEACILGCMFAVSMLLCRMPYITLVSVLIAFTALIPLVGAFIGCGVGALLIAVQNPMQAVWFIVLFLCLQQLEGNLVYPRVVGNSVGLPSIWVLAAVTLGGSLFGVGGMLLMIPLCSVAYTLLREWTRRRLRQRGIGREKLLPQNPKAGRYGGGAGPVNAADDPAPGAAAPGAKGCEKPKTML